MLGSFLSAQRLPASWNRSPSRKLWEERELEVLNAFRHHGIGHLFARIFSFSFGMCSTPSGIMESVTEA